MTFSIPNVVWRHPEAPLALAVALGQIAADLWLAGKVALTDGMSMVTGDTDEKDTTSIDLHLTR